MVYGKIFRKPFSKTREGALIDPFHAFLLSLFSLSALCSLSHRPEPPPATPPATQSHPPRATPSTPSHLAFSLAQLMPSQPRATSLSLSPISLLAPKPPPPSPSHRSHLAFSLTDLSARTEATVTVAPKPPSLRSHLKGPSSIPAPISGSNLDLI
uniref:Uncharacterized protein n=1 Tax=Fagus sylvatica TaxID=28930 RepID=A0A2N9GYR2_FAGSY